MLIKLKGTSFHQKEIEHLDKTGIRTAFLFPEPWNPHDQFAMAIRWNTFLIGYLPRGWQNTDYGRKVIQILKKEEGAVKLQIVGGFQMLNGEKALLGVDIIL